MKLITFVIPLYNRESTIGETLSSILKLDHKEVQVYVVDDGSEDGSIEIVKKFQEENANVELFHRKEFSQLKGASVCRNIGLKKVATPYVHFTDSDDLVGEDALSYIKKAINKHPLLDFYVFQTQMFNKVIGDRNELQTIRNDKNIIDRFLDEKSVWNNFGPVWKTESIRSIHGYSEEYTSFQDWDLMMRALIHDLKFDYFNLDHPIWFYRQDSNATISKNRYTPEHISSNFKMINSIYKALVDNNLLNEKRRKYLANFATQVLFRCQFHKEAMKGNLFSKLIDSDTLTVFREDEINYLTKAFKKRSLKLYNLFPPYRKWIRSKSRRSSFSYLFDKSSI